MSGKKQQGHGAAPPAPTPETPPAEPVAQPIAPDTLTTETPIGTLPSEPFEPPLHIPPANPDLSPEAVRAELAELSLVREKLEEDRKDLENEREGLIKARELLEKDREQLEEDRRSLEELRNPKPKGEPQIVKVKALRGVTDPLRVQHRNAGDVFRVREDDAKRLEEQGEVEIL